MKLNMVDAIKALSEGKCEKIKDCNGTYYELNGEILIYSDNPFFEDYLSSPAILGKWELVDVKPVKKP